MTRDDKVAILVEQWIPDSLRLSEDHDARLVSSAITAVIGAIYDSDRITMKAQSPEVREALSRWTDTIYAEHMAKEREHYSSIEEKASRAVDTISNLEFTESTDERARKKGMRGWVTFNDSRHPGKLLKAAITGHTSELDGTETYTAMVPEYGVAGYGSTPIGAVEDAARETGAYRMGR